MRANRSLDEAAVEEWRERVPQPETHGGAALGDEAGGWDPFPRSPVLRGKMPATGHVGLSAARLREDLLARQEPELDADAGKADALAQGLRARGDVVVAAQLAAPHPRAIVQHREGGLGGIGQERDVAGARVE